VLEFVKAAPILSERAEQVKPGRRGGTLDDRRSIQQVSAV
jgi:hypothetical protein